MVCYEQSPKERVCLHRPEAAAWKSLSQPFTEDSRGSGRVFLPWGFGISLGGSGQGCCSVIQIVSNFLLLGLQIGPQIVM